MYRCMYINVYIYMYMYVSTTLLLYKAVIKATCFDIDQSSSGLFRRLSHKVLCTYWDPSLCISIKYIKSDHLPKEV